jgi:hypothetical protein
MRIDHHAHVGKDVGRWKFESNVDDLRRTLDNYQIDKAVVFACANLTVQPLPYKLNNDIILEGAQKDNRLVPFMFIHPYLDTLEHIKSNEANFAGFKVYCNAHGLGYSYADMTNQEQIQIIMNLEKPVVFHIAKKDLKEFSVYKNVFIDVSPLATLFERKEIFLADRAFWSPNINFDSKHKFIDTVLDYLDSLYPGRLVWGSDTPWSDNLGSEKYAGEACVLDRMIEKNISSTFLK